VSTRWHSELSPSEVANAQANCCAPGRRQESKLRFWKRTRQLLATNARITRALDDALTTYDSCTHRLAAAKPIAVRTGFERSQAVAEASGNLASATMDAKSQVRSKCRHGARTRRSAEPHWTLLVDLLHQVRATADALFQVTCTKETARPSQRCGSWCPTALCGIQFQGKPVGSMTSAACRVE